MNKLDAHQSSLVRSRPRDPDSQTLPPATSSQNNFTTDHEQTLAPKRGTRSVGWKGKGRSSPAPQLTVRRCALRVASCFETDTSETLHDRRMAYTELTAPYNTTQGKSFVGLGLAARYLKGTRR